METVGAYCGMGEPEQGRHIEFAGATIKYPEEIHEIVMDETLADKDRIKEIAASEWAVNQAKALCTSMFEGEEAEAEACVDRVATMLAEKIAA